MSISKHHAEWLSLIEVSGPFLTLPVLERVFPQGLDPVDSDHVAKLSLEREEWGETQRNAGPDVVQVHRGWVKTVLEETLELGPEVLLSEGRIQKSIRAEVPEHGEILKPDFVVVDPCDGPSRGKPRLLGAVWPFEQDLEGGIEGSAWAASPAERMTHLCRATGVRLGLVTNGERWMLVDAPHGETPGYASWDSFLWVQEPLTLRAFRSLLGARRFFSVADTDTLEKMLEESVAYQEEVTDQLGNQVRRAVEVLIQALDRADVDRGRKLLEGVPPGRLYDAALTMMMRLVVLFCAEERDLLLLGDPTYDAHYAVSPLRGRLREEADRVGIEVLERRQDAWSRLLSTFRAVYAGLDHDMLRLPALGGSIFDPDRFPFLEGRPEGSSWKDTQAYPLPIDNRTVLHLLESLQLLQMKGREGSKEARRLSFRALDVEQIGYIYEGLLDHVAIRVTGPTIGLVGTKGKEPEILLDDLEEKRAEGEDRLIEFLKECTGRSTSALKRALGEKPDETTREHLLVACGNDHALLERVLPFHALVRGDVWMYPQIYRAESFVVTGGPERRETGTHYTPKFLTEAIVTETLEPLAYLGPAKGKPREEWKLRTPAALLDLKICDMAMGSGAFLVQACRWLAERMVEAWDVVEQEGQAVTADGDVVASLDGKESLTKGTDDRILLAKRLVTERCLYGVDINPMAVELAKLSLWLVTLAKGRPFGFLDHNLRCGDSLLGVTDLDQIRHFHPDPKRGKELHRSLFDYTKHFEPAIRKALELRESIRRIRIIDIEDVKHMTRLDGEARQATGVVHLLADFLIGATLATSGGRDSELEGMLRKYSGKIDLILTDTSNQIAKRRDLEMQVRQLLDVDRPMNLRVRRPFHWALEFPEVFTREDKGFDGVVGNPPFKGGRMISGSLGKSYREYIAKWVGKGERAPADLVAYFFLRAYELIREGGNFGLLAVNTIAEGDTRQVGLESLLKNGGSIYSAHPNEPWPGQAAVVTSRVQTHKGQWEGGFTISGKSVETISAYLSDRYETSPKTLDSNKGKCFQGSIVLGMGFLLTEEEAIGLIKRDPKNRDVLFPYLIGEELTSHPEQKPSRWVINFWDWPEDRAKKYQEIYSILKKRVYAERLEKSKMRSYSKIMDTWWLFWRNRSELYHSIGRGHAFEKHPEDWDPEIKPMKRLIALSMVSKAGAFAFVPNDAVFSMMLVLFATDQERDFALLNSCIHTAWVRKQASTMKRDLRYTPSDCLETFPLPAEHDVLSSLGRSLDETRSNICRQEWIGLTDLYNRFHDPKETSRRFQGLRENQVLIDQITAQAYGWDDIDLAHDFHEVAYLPDNDRLRFTISD